MAKGKGEEGQPPHLVWVYAGRLEKEINAVTWLEMTRRLRAMGWRVTLVAQGKRGRFSLSGVQVKTLPAPDIFFIRQLVFHLQLVFLVLGQWRDDRFSAF